MKNEKNDKESKTAKPVPAAEPGKVQDKAAAKNENAGCGEDENSCGGSGGCCCCGD